MTGVPGWARAAVGGAICGLLGIDLLASHRPGMSRAVLLSAAWVGAGIGFGLILTVWQGADTGQQYFAAYLLEKALSVDNLFIFALLFQAFAVPAARVTTDTFIVFTANAFAILGLRALYLVLAGTVERFTYLRPGMAVLLAFIAAKMMLSPVLHVPAAMSLGAIVAIIAAAAGLSLLKKRRTTARAEAPDGGEPALPPAPGDAERIHA